MTQRQIFLVQRALFIVAGQDLQTAIEQSISSYPQAEVLDFLTVDRNIIGRNVVAYNTMIYFSANR